MKKEITMSAEEYKERLIKYLIEHFGCERTEELMCIRKNDREE